jgi:hypothetical protein
LEVVFISVYFRTRNPVQFMFNERLRELCAKRQALKVPCFTGQAVWCCSWPLGQTGALENLIKE